MHKSTVYFTKENTPEAYAEQIGFGSRAYEMKELKIV